jgi:hypothetical protein
MKMTHTTVNGRTSVEFEANSHKVAWRVLASFDEVFEESTCGKCKSENIRHVIRKAKDKKQREYEYFELRCADCGAKLPFGILDDGTDNLFPKRRDEEGKMRGKRGWVKWNPETEQEE